MPTHQEHVTILTDKKRVRVMLFRRGRIWYYRFWAHGVPRYSSSRSGDLRTAKSIARAAVLSVFDGHAQGSGIRLADAVEKYMRSRWPMPIRSATRSEHAQRLRRFLTHAGDVLVPADRAEATRMIQRYIDSRRSAGVCAQTAINDLRVIHRLCSWMMRCLDPYSVAWQSNPASLRWIDCPRPHVRAPRPIAAESVRALLDGCRGTLAEPAVILAYGAGLRPIECLRVRYCDITLDGAPFVLADGKKKQQQVPLTQ